MSRLSDQQQAEFETAKVEAETEAEPQVVIMETPEPVPNPLANKKLYIAIFAGLSVALGIYSEVIDISFLQKLFTSN